MLQNIRDRSQGWLTGVIVFILSLSFGIWGIESYISGNGQSDSAAKVDGHVIQQADLNAAYERLRQQQQFQLGADFVFDQKVEIQLKKQALDQLIMGQILAQAATKEGYRVTTEEVDSGLLTIPAFQVNGRFSRERFKEVLGGILYTEQAFLDDLRATMLIDQVRLGFLTSAFALPGEVDAAIKLVNQKRDLGYLIVPASRFNNAVQVSDKEAQAYYQQHQSEFTVPEKVSIDYLQLSLAQLAAQMHFTDEQLQQFYRDNINSFTSPTRWHVAHILVKVPKDATPQQVAAAKAAADKIEQRLHAGESFTKLAQTSSDDVMSAKNGGVLDWFSVGMVDPSLEKIVVTLKQPGDISAPTQTKYGFSIIKLLDIQKPEAMPFPKVRSQVEKALSQQKAEQNFANENDQLSNLTYSNPTSLNVAAKTLGLQIKTTDLFDRQGSKEGVTSNPKVLAAAFNLDVLQGNNSGVIELSPDTVIVLRVKQHKPAAVKPFVDVRKQISEQLSLQMVEQRAQKFGEELLQKMRDGSNGQQVASQAKLTWKTVQGAGRYGAQAPTAILNAAFHMPRPQNQKASSAGLRLPNGDYAVVSVMAVHDGVVEDTADTKQRVFGEEIENADGRLDYGLYVDALVKKAKVVINQPKS